MGMCPRGFLKYEIVGEVMATFTEMFIGRRRCSWDEQNLLLNPNLLSSVSWYLNYFFPIRWLITVGPTLY